ncbi:hypothetical protein FO519_007316 [Halicephalobus sp. NKZ332]|nr:hypothetical protein FO519_007316 [Halicephalobus sp. NKZ332]
MHCFGRILTILLVLANVVSGENNCDCHDIPTCRCEKYACHCKQSIEAPCVCKMPPREEFDNCLRDCQPSCLGSCLAFNPPGTCETTCASACAITCPPRIKSTLLKTSLVEFCLNDCLADCLLSSDFRKHALLDGKAKKQCQDLCQSSCENTVLSAVEVLPHDGVLFATEDTNLKQATFSKYGCLQKCNVDCNEKCSASGAPGEVCTPSCDAFCSEKCDVAGPKLPGAMCVSACRPDCDRACVLDKTLDLIFGFVEKTKNLTLPSLEQLIYKEKPQFPQGQFHQLSTLTHVIPVATETRLLPPPQVLPQVPQAPPQILPQTPQILPQASQIPPQIPQPPPQVLPQASQIHPQIHQSMPLTPDPAIKLPQVPTSANCQSVCLPSCLIQCQALQRPNLNCTRSVLKFVEMLQGFFAQDPQNVMEYVKNPAANIVSSTIRLLLNVDQVVRNLARENVVYLMKSGTSVKQVVWELVEGNAKQLPQRSP